MSIDIKYIRLTVLVALTTFLGLKLSAQDLHFSQFYYAPMQLNPALTAVFPCNTRVIANYRNQWTPALSGSAAFTSYSVSYENRFTSGYKDYWGIGFNAVRDQAGTTNFQTTEAQLSASYSKHLGGQRWRGSHYLTAGADLAYVNRGIDFLMARYGIQNTNGIYDPSISSGENFPSNSLNYADLSAGLLWYGQMRQGHGWYLGLAAHHLNRPDQSFDNSDADIRIYNRYTVHAGGEIVMGPQWSVLPSILYFNQGPSEQLNGGASLKYYASKRRGREKAFQLGVWTRLVNEYIWANEEMSNTEIGMDAVIVHARFITQNFNFGFSYDINTSDLTRAAQINNAFEFSVVYTLCGPEKRNTYCPAF